MIATSVVSVKEKISESALRDAGKLLREGKLVAMPTETVYGLGVNLENPEAVRRLYQVKGRPNEKELTLAIADKSDVEKQRVVVPSATRRLIDHFWPGPLTILFRGPQGEKIGMRMPGHPVARKVIAYAGCPIGLPSANPSGQKPPKSAEEVLAYFEGEIDLILDGGKTALGTSSTVVDVSEGTLSIVREGAIPRKEIEAVWQE